jgi:hypothetical protein
MRFNLTVVLTLLLLTIMGGAGLATAMWGFKMGDEALKGISTPDARPTRKPVNGSKAATGGEGLMFLREEDILAKVKADIEAKGGTKEAPVPVEVKPVSAPANFPLSTKSQGVSLDIDGVSQSGSSVILEVRLRNEGSAAVRFLYSFLSLTDDQGRALSGVTQGLPGEFPPTGEEYRGKISMPIALLGDAKSVSLSLADYPDQRVQLRVNDIPLAR